VRRLAAGDFSGRVTMITGPGRASGKTSLLNAALALLRGAGESPAFLGIGFDGERKDLEGGRSQPSAGRGSPRIAVAAGELFVSAEGLIGPSATLPEILALLPGRSALGRLALVRARRPGEVVLVGPDSNEVAALAVRLAREEGGASTVLVDGAFNRLTQVASLEGAGFLSSLRIDAAGLERALEHLRLLGRLSSLPVHEEREGEALVHAVQGPLTAGVLETVPESARILVAEDLTKVFLGEAELGVLARRRELRVRRAMRFGGFVLVLHGVTAERVMEGLEGRVPEELLIENPYEVGRAEDAA